MLDVLQQLALLVDRAADLGRGAEVGVGVGRRRTGKGEAKPSGCRSGFDPRLLEHSRTASSP